MDLQSIWIMTRLETENAIEDKYDITNDDLGWGLSITFFQKGTNIPVIRLTYDRYVNKNAVEILFSDSLRRYTKATRAEDIIFDAVDYSTAKLVGSNLRKAIEAYHNADRQVFLLIEE